MKLFYENIFVTEFFANHSVNVEDVLNQIDFDEMEFCKEHCLDGLDYDEFHFLDENLAIKEQLLSLGMKESEIDRYSSDLYVKENFTSLQWFESYEWKNNVTSFIDDEDNSKWFEIPFGFMNEWIELRKAGKA